MQPPTDTIPASSQSETSPGSPSRPARTPSRRVIWLLAVGLLLLAGAVWLRTSRWGRAHELSRLSSHSLALLALERPNDPLVQEHLGMRLYDERDLPGSIQAFSAAVRLDPRLEQAQLGLGLAFMAAGRPGDAEPCLARALQLRPKDPRPYSAFADLFSRYRNSRSAIPPLKKLIELSPGDASAWYRLGMAWGDLAQFDQALECLEKAVKLNGRQATYLRDLGQLQIHFGQLDAAKMSLDRARDLNPKDPGTLILLAQLRTRQEATPEQLREGEALLGDALRIDPRYAPAYRELGMLYLRRHDAPQAVAALRQAVRYDPSDGQALFQLGQALIRAGKREEGEKMIAGFKLLTEARRTVFNLEDRIHADPKSPDLRLQMARVYRRYGRDDNAVNQYQIYLSMKPEDWPVKDELKGYMAALRRPGAPKPAP